MTDLLQQYALGNGKIEKLIKNACTYAVHMYWVGKAEKKTSLIT